MSLKTISLNFLDYFSLKTKKKFILFLSDDWGSIRIKSYKEREAMLKAGIHLEGNRFDKYDTLETNEDLEELFNVLLKHKDSKGKHPVITSVACVTNPDFKKIKDNEFKDYYYKELSETVCEYPESNNILNLYKKGIELGIFIPEPHGREHLNITRWLKALQTNDYATRICFENEFFHVPPENLPNKFNRGFAAAFDIDHIHETTLHKNIIEDNVRIFRQLFGYQPTMYAPPAQHYNYNIETYIKSNGIDLLDVPRLQKMPFGENNYKIRLNYTGKKSKSGLTYIVRNSVFEPNMNENSDSVNECLLSIEKAFNYKKPSIISNHRTAFTGGLDLKNRKKGIKALDILFKRILEKWPDVEFISINGLLKEYSLDRK